MNLRDSSAPDRITISGQTCTVGVSRRDGDSRRSTFQRGRGTGSFCLRVSSGFACFPDLPLRRRTWTHGLFPVPNKGSRWYGKSSTHFRSGMSRSQEDKFPGFCWLFRNPRRFESRGYRAWAQQRCPIPTKAGFDLASGFRPKSLCACAIKQRKPASSGLSTSQEMILHPALVLNEVGDDGNFKPLTLIC
jgi:hypothetical protein